MQRRHQMAKELERRIFEGELNPGEPLASERDLALEFGLSRASVRETLREMAEAGLLDIQPGRGTFVTRPTSGQPVAGILRWAKRAGVTARNVIDARIALESESARRAAGNARPDEVDLLRAVLIHLDNEHDPVVSSQLDIAFHLGIARCAGNPVAEMLLTTLAPLTADLVASTMDLHEVVQTRAGQHRAIVDAIAQGNADLAAREMENHLRAGATFLASFDDPLPFDAVLPDTTSLDDLLRSTGTGAWPVLSIRSGSMR